MIHLVNILLGQSAVIPLHAEFAELKEAVTAAIYGVGILIGGVLAAWKVVDRFVPGKQGRKDARDICPLGADPELKAILAQNMSALTALANAAVKTDAQHAIHTDRLDQIRQAVDRLDK